MLLRACNNVDISAHLCLCWFVSKVYWRSAEMTPLLRADGRAPSSKETTRVRIDFPETWLWSESLAGYHLTPAVICAAELVSLSWCICHQNYFWSFVPVLPHFSTQNIRTSGPFNVNSVALTLFNCIVVSTRLCAGLCWKLTATMRRSLYDHHYYYSGEFIADISPVDGSPPGLKELTRVRVEFQ